MAERWRPFRWHGELPRVGHYLMAERGRKAFEICEIRRSASDRYPYRFKVRALPPSEMPEHAQVHTFKWDRS